MRAVDVLGCGDDDEDGDDDVLGADAVSLDVARPYHVAVYPAHNVGAVSFGDEFNPADASIQRVVVYGAAKCRPPWQGNRSCDGPSRVEVYLTGEAAPRVYPGSDESFARGVDGVSIDGGTVAPPASPKIRAAWKIPVLSSLWTPKRRQRVGDLADDPFDQGGGGGGYDPANDPRFDRQSVPSGTHRAPAHAPRPRAVMYRRSAVIGADAGPSVGDSATYADRATVLAVQQKLLRDGAHLPKYGADGQYGAETAAAIRFWRKAQGWDEGDGLIHPDLLAAMGIPIPPAPSTDDVKRAAALAEDRAARAREDAAKAQAEAAKAPADASKKAAADKALVDAAAEKRAADDLAARTTLAAQFMAAPPWKKAAVVGLGAVGVSAIGLGLWGAFRR